MNLNDIKITRKELNIIAKKRSIEDPHKISTNDLMNTLIRHNKKRKSYNIRRKINKLNLKKIRKNKISQKKNYINLQSYKINH